MEAVGATPPANGARSAVHEDADARWSVSLDLGHDGEAKSESPEAESPRFRRYLGVSAEYGEQEEKQMHTFEDGEGEGDEDGEDDEDDDWMVAHLAALETKRRASTSIQEVEASVRAALSILNQSSDGAGTSQQDEDEEDAEREREREREGEGDSGRVRYFDFVQEAMEARWSLSSPNQNLLSEEETRGFRPGVHEIPESDGDEDEDGDEGENEEGGERDEEREETVTAGDNAAATANGVSAKSNGASVEAASASDEANAQDVELAGNQADDEWQEAYTAKGRVYYYNRRTRESSPAKYRANARPQSPGTGNSAPSRAVVRQSLGYHASSNESPRSLADQRHLFCCFCGAKHSPQRFPEHFRECQALNFHKKTSSELYREFQKVLTVLSEDPSLRTMHYASSFPDAHPVPLLQDNLALLRRHQEAQHDRPSTAASRRSEPISPAARADRDRRSRPKDSKKQARPARTGAVSTPTSSAEGRAKVSGGFATEVETCRYCGRSFAEGRLAKHEAVCPRVFGNEGSWGRGTPSPAAVAGSAAAPASTPPAPKRRSLVHRRQKVSKSLADAHTLEASYKEHQAALVVCPCCRRKFAPSGAQQHIAICKSVQNRPKNPISLLKDYATAG